MSDQNPIPVPDYLKGHDFTNRLKEVLGCKDFAEVSRILGVPKSTFSTWNLHNRTSHELMVRIHLALGIPVESLALKSKDRTRKEDVVYIPPMPEQVLQSNSDNSSHQTILLESFYLNNGQLVPTGEIPYAYRRLNSYGLLNADVVEVETNEAVYLVDRGINTVLSGKYLIDIDGMLSINPLQRLPGKRIALALGDNAIEVAEEDIVVVGRVAVVLESN